MPRIDSIDGRYVTIVILNHTEPGFNQLQNWKKFNSSNLCLTVFIRVSTGRASSRWGSLNFWGTVILSLNKAGFFLGSTLNRFNGGLCSYIIEVCFDLLILVFLPPYIAWLLLELHFWSSVDGSTTSTNMDKLIRVLAVKYNWGWWFSIFWLN